MLFRRLTLFAAAVLLSVPLVRAQDTNFVPQGMDALAAHASFHTDFTFDKSMLQAAGQLMSDEDQRILAELRSISVHSFRYPAPGLYDAASLEAVRAQYGNHGWHHLVTRQAHAETEDPTRTDLWVRMAHGNVDGMVLLVANERNVNLVTVDGTLSPLDLLHLRGHFGIPRFQGDDFEDAR